MFNTYLVETQDLGKAQQSNLKKNCFIWGMGQKAAMTNKTRTSKVGAISKAQKAQNIFLDKNLKFLKIFFSENVAQCRKM